MHLTLKYHRMLEIMIIRAIVLHTFLDRIIISSSQCTRRYALRTQCGDVMTSEQDCTSRGCCYDSERIMCFYRDDCTILSVVSGGASSFTILPGEDADGFEHMTPGGGGHWCLRQNNQYFHKITLQFHLPRVQEIHMKVFPVVANISEIPFRIKALLYGDLQKPGIDLNVGRQAIYQSHFWLSFHASWFTLTPTTDEATDACYQATFIGCNAQIDPPNSSEVVESVPKHASTVTAVWDTRPSATAVGSLGLILIISVTGFLFVLDLPTYKSNFIYMKRCILSNTHKDKRKQSTLITKKNSRARLKQRTRPWWRYKKEATSKKSRCYQRGTQTDVTIDNSDCSKTLFEILKHRLRYIDE